MQPGSPDDPYNQQPPQQPGSYPPPGGYQPPGGYPPPGGQQPPPGDPYGQQPTSGGPYGQQPPGYPTSGGAYPPPGGYQPPAGDPYGQQSGAYPPPGGFGAAPQNTQGLVGMIMGIASIPLLCCFYLGLPVGIAAVVVSYLGLNKVKAGVANNRGQALAGLICGGVAVVLGIIGLIVSIATDAWNFNSYSNL